MIILFTLTFFTTCLPHTLPLSTFSCAKVAPPIMNFAVRFCVEVFLEIVLCVMINLNQPHILVLGSRLSMISAVGIAVLCLGFICLTTFLSYTVDKRRNEVFPYCKTLLFGMNLKHPERAATFQTWFLVRRVLLAISIVFFSRFPLLQIILAVMCSTVMLRILWKTNPFDLPDDCSQHLLNETFIFVTSCSMICFTDIYTDLETRIEMRYMYFGILMITLLSNMVFILNAVCKQILLHKKKWLNARDEILRPA